MLERRANPIGRAATAGIPRITLGGLRIAVLDLEQTADFMVNLVFPQRRLARPLYLTSANGEVLARCSTEPMTDRLFRSADLINADGQPLVTVSRLTSPVRLPERKLNKPPEVLMMPTLVSRGVNSATNACS